MKTAFSYLVPQMWYRYILQILSTYLASFWLFMSLQLYFLEKATFYKLILICTSFNVNYILSGFEK